MPTLAPNTTKSGSVVQRLIRRSLPLWVIFVVLIAACAEQSFEGVDLAPEGSEFGVSSLPPADVLSDDVGGASDDDDSVVEDASASNLSAEPNDAATTSTTSTDPPPNPADLGRVPTEGIFYVSPDGNDASDGTVPSRAFGTINFAASQLQPGNQLFLLDGVFVEEFRPDTAVMITAKGTADDWIRISAFPGHSPIVAGPERNSFKLEGAEYLELSGIEMEGSGTNLLGAGVHVENPSHHIRIVNNVVHGFPAGGINITGSSHITIAGNEVFDNANFHDGQHSGISIWRPQNLGIPDDEAGYSFYVLGNTVYDNRNTVPGEGGITDGNCIILDQTTITGYDGRTLIANNVCFGNGGRGVNIHQSTKADVVNNTVFQNLESLDLEGTNGELMAYEADDVRFVNNLTMPNAGELAAVASRSDNIIFVDNLFVADEDPDVGSENTLLSGDLLESVVTTASTDPLIADFSLAPQSPAIDTGRSDFAGLLGVDRLNAERLIGTGVDIGALESPVP